MHNPSSQWYKTPTSQRLTTLIQKESKYSLSFDKQFMYADGDVQLLILTKETSIQLSTNFPEEYGVITANLLRSMDLDEEGEADIFKHVFL